MQQTGRNAAFTLPQRKTLNNMIRFHRLLRHSPTAKHSLSHGTHLSMRGFHSAARTSSNQPITMHHMKISNMTKEAAMDSPPLPLPPLVIVHGLFGSHMNFKTFARESAVSGKREVYLVDLRNHGISPHDDRMDVTAMKDDLIYFIDNVVQRETVDLLGFSLGGKATMSTALSEGSERIRRMIVGDIAPHAYEGDEWDIPHVVQCMQYVEPILETEFKSRGVVDNALKECGLQDPNTRAFLLSNIVPKDENDRSKGHKWRINLNAIANNLDSIADFPMAADTTPFTKPTLFIKGGRSKMISDADLPVITKLFPQSRVTVFENSAHWVHVEERQRFLKECSSFLNAPDPE